MPDNPVNVASKVNVLFQVIMQAFQIYLRNVEMIIYNSYPDKLLVLIDFVFNATKICFDRMVFNKRDKMIQQMLRKCDQMKQFLQAKQQSRAKFASISEYRKKSLFSRSSFAYEVPNASKFSMYESSTYKNKQTMKQKSTRSPYVAPKSREVKSSKTEMQKKPQKVPSRQVSRIRSPMLKKSGSNVSTVMSRMKQRESKESLKTVSEKPFEDALRGVPKEDELREILRNVAEEKISQMLMPFIEQFKNKQQEMLDSPKFKVRENSRENFDKKSISKREKMQSRATSEVPHSLEVVKPSQISSEVQKSSRVTSEVHVHKSPPQQPQKSFEKVDRIAKNVQYLYIKSQDESRGQLKPAAATQSIPTQTNFTFSNHLPRETKILTAMSKPPIPVKNTSKSDDEIYMKKMKAIAIKERLNVIEQQSRNPLYVNEVCDEPWKLVSRISDRIVDDALKNVLVDMDFGEKMFIEKFLRSELTF